MASMDKHWDRQALLLAMCDVAAADPKVLFRGWDVQLLLGWDDDRFERAAIWIVDHELVRARNSGGLFQMTPKGIEITKSIAPR